MHRLPVLQLPGVRFLGKDGVVLGNQTFNCRGGAQMSVENTFTLDWNLLAEPYQNILDVCETTGLTHLEIVEPGEA